MAENNIVVLRRTRNSWRYLTANERLSVARMHVAGDPIALIAAAFGIHENTVCRYARAANLPKRTAYVKILTEDEKQAAAARYSAGETSKAIARDLGVDSATVISAISRRGATI